MRGGAPAGASRIQEDVREVLKEFRHINPNIVTFITVLKHALDPRTWPPTSLRRIEGVIPGDCVLPGQGFKRHCYIL